MSKKLIKQFMWSYQHVFQSVLKLRMNEVMKELGIPEAGVECLLVGTLIPRHENSNKVCIEPEDGKWPIDLFEDLLDMIEVEVINHPSRYMIYFNDEASMRNKPEAIRLDSVRRAVQKIFDAYDSDHDVSSFAGNTARVGDYYVVPVLQLPSELFRRFRPLRELPASDSRIVCHTSLIHAAVSEMLSDAHDELIRPDPSYYANTGSRSPQEIVRRAAKLFMYTPGVYIEGGNYLEFANLFERFNLISSLMYERTEGKGRLLLTNPEGGFADMILTFVEPVPFSDSRWSRKVLQMASSDIALVGNCGKIFGLGRIADEIDPWANQNIFEVEFLDHLHWRLSCGDEVMIVSKDGVPSLPQEKFPRDRLLDTYQRLFPEVEDEHIRHFHSIYEVAVDQNHGNMLIVAKDAESEAYRLRGQGTRIRPRKLTPDLYRQVSGIDGTTIIDPYGVCYAIGVILDGPTRPECTPSRGSRYNSGIRYVGATDTPRLAVVVSDDRTVDIIPVLRPRIKRSNIEEAIVEIETANQDNYHQAMNWLHKHRFYLNQGQCNRINMALGKIANEPKDIGEIRIIYKFSPDPDLNESYFESEDTGFS